MASLKSVGLKINFFLLLLIKVFFYGIQIKAQKLEDSLILTLELLILFQWPKRILFFSSLEEMISL